MRLGLGIAVIVGILALCCNALVRGEPLHFSLAVPKQMGQRVTGSALVQQSETPEQEVRTLLSLLHGLNRLSPEDRKRLKRATDNPGPYIQALKSIYAGRVIADLKDPEATLRFERAVILLSLIGTKEALDQVADWYKALDKPNAATSAAARDRALHFKRVILSSLGTAKQEEVITSILKGLETMDYATRIAAFEYVRRSAANDSRIKNELTRLLNDRRSSLYQDKALRRTLELMSKPN